MLRGCGCNWRWEDRPESLSKKCKGYALYSFLLANFMERPFFFFLELLPKYDVNLTKYLQALHRQYNPCIAAHILKIPLSIITEL